MKIARKDFTEEQKAIIYVRDRATCALSTESLWILDHGIKSDCLYDWIDHIKPCALGGGADLENGICASNKHNMLKGTDIKFNRYYVKNGNITAQFIQDFGEPSSEILERLNRLKNLEPADWYFNRSIIGIYEVYLCRLHKEFLNKEYKRGEDYWFNAAWKRLATFHKKKGPLSIIERGLVKSPVPNGSLELLELESVNKEEKLRDWVERNYNTFRRSYMALNGII